VATTRTPINRPPVNPITPRALAIYRQIVEADASCACEDWGCEHCARFWKLQGELSNELKCRPWQWPPVIPPWISAENDGSMWYADGRRLFDRLAEAAEAAKKARVG
jgi:hypothetical protein